MVKAKKKQLSEVSQQKRNLQNKKRLNPFEVHINKDKQNVLGRKSKTDKGLPGISRAKAINKRKGTLLQEYKLKNKDNVFLDKRIGEKNFAMSEEEKATIRFTKERIKAHKKKNIYSLNDEVVLTHRGQTLEEIEKFDDPKSDDEFSDDEKTGKLDNKFVGDAHFGGGVLSKQESGKSRKDLIDELIAESKKRKAEKQKIREQTIDLTEKLDSEWRDLLPIVSAANKALEQADNKLKADDYDIAVRQLKFEARGTPSDKLKSEEEIVKEAKEKLEALEADRLARMKGFVNDTNEIRHKSADDLDDGFILQNIADEPEHDNDKGSVASQEHDSSEDENDDASDSKSVENNEESNLNSDNNGDESKNVQFAPDEQSENVEEKSDTKEKDEENRSDKLSMNDEANVDSDKADSESESSDEDNLSDLKESESSSEDESPPCKKNVKFVNNTERTSKPKKNLDSNEPKSILKVKNNEPIQPLNNKDREQEIRDDLLKRKEIMEKARKELPYTYKAPETFEELEKLLENHNSEYQSVIIDRIIKCNHWTLDGKNKEKLSNLFLYLLQHLNNCAVVSDEESAVNCFQIFDR